MSPAYHASNSDTAAPAPQPHEYACLMIGDELLGGKIADSNLPKVIAKLAAVGYELKEARIVSDDPHDIAKHLSELRDAFAFVVTMGGLGPTHDDRTMLGYALSFGRPREVNGDMLAFFMRKPRTTKDQLDAVHYMSTMPEGAEIIQTSNLWPLIKVDNCFALPGLPSVCMTTADTLASVLPPRAARLNAECYTSLVENEFAQELTRIASLYPLVAIGSYPFDTEPAQALAVSLGIADALAAKNVSLRGKISLSSFDEAQIRACFDEVAAYVQSRGAALLLVKPR